MKILRRTQFGNPVLRSKTRRLTPKEVKSADIQELIADMQYTLKEKKYGIGLAATQVGSDVALSVIGIKPTPTRPQLKELDLVIINPEIIEHYGDKEPMWEGCISFGDIKNFPYAQVPRYKKIRLKWLDENAVGHEQEFEDTVAHVIQHEVDHLNGVLFVDRVEDTTSFMNISEYKKRNKPQK